MAAEYIRATMLGMTTEQGFAEAIKEHELMEMLKIRENTSTALEMRNAECYLR